MSCFPTFRSIAFLSLSPFVSSPTRFFCRLLQTKKLDIFFFNSVTAVSAATKCMSQKRLRTAKRSRNGHGYSSLTDIWARLSATRSPCTLRKVKKVLVRMSEGRKKTTKASGGSSVPKRCFCEQASSLIFILMCACYGGKHNARQ